LATLRLGAELLRDHLDQAARQADFAGFEQRVLAGIRHSQPAGWTERFGVWLRESLTHNRATWVASVATAAALVLALALWLPQRPGPATDPIAPPDATQLAAAQVDNEVIIDSLEYTGNRSMIFTVSKNNTTVIWMVDFDKSGAKGSQGDEL
jgi:anti-sigma-K factor RskA